MKTNIRAILMVSNLDNNGITIHRTSFSMTLMLTNDFLNVIYFKVVSSKRYLK